MVGQRATAGDQMLLVDRDFSIAGQTKSSL
jgi:hypothetical protein